VRKSNEVVVLGNSEGATSMFQKATHEAHVVEIGLPAVLL
jgi:hypothetical protein